MASGLTYVQELLPGNSPGHHAMVSRPHYELKLCLTNEAPNLEPQSRTLSLGQCRLVGG